MNYQVFVSENGKYVVCKVSGSITAELALEFSAVAHELLLEKDLKRLLSDVREAKNVLSAGRNYKYAYQDMRQLQLQRNVRVATLVKPDDHSHDFVETVSRNAGYQVRIFRDHDAAIAWLEQ